MKKFPLIILTPSCPLRSGINYEAGIWKVCKNSENMVITTYSLIRSRDLSDNRDL